VTPNDRGARIALLRIRMGLSQRDLARALDVQHTTVARWERDGAPVLAALAVAHLAEHSRKEIHP
jgi:transcriptional regulator with XRE-family HTH domain